MTMQIIGIDYSTEPVRTGLALGSFDGSKVVVKDVKLGSKAEPPVEIVLRWLKEEPVALLAIDAPLGWPSDFARTLSIHEAGNPVQFDGEMDDFFSRLTDRVVQQELGKRPLEVGANLIARTAFGALRLLKELREGAQLEIPLAWQQGEIIVTSVIEVYPASTMRALGIRSEDYRRSSGVKALNVEPLSKESQTRVENSPHALDAVICLAAATDFLAAKCIPIPDVEKAHKEGWIWVRQPKA
jgi:predicted RNase H-like nuclease